MQVERVIKMAGTESGPAVGALTSENRDVWADVSPFPPSFPSLVFPSLVFPSSRGALPESVDRVF